MIQDQDKRMWPGSAGGVSVSCFVYARGRQTEGVGAMAYMALLPADLAIVAPSGRDFPMSVSAIRETIITHFLTKDTFTAWYSPKNVTIEAALRAALASVAFPGGASSVTVFVNFDGQFGSVYAA